MVGCETCGTLRDRVGKAQNHLVVVAADDELRRRVLRCLERAGIECESFGATLYPAVADVTQVFRALAVTKELTTYQRDRVQIFEVDSHRVADLATGTNLTRLVAQFDAPEIRECLEQRRLETHFQPIVSTSTREVVAYEALTRGRTIAGDVISPDRLFSYAHQAESVFFLDRLARETAITTAATLGLTGRLFINFLPNAIYDPRQCLRTTIAIAEASNFDPGRIVFEVTESEHILDFHHLNDIFRYYRSHGFKVALDDVGSGFAGLTSLVRLYPDVIKIDRELITEIHQDRFRRAIVEGLTRAALAEGIEVVAEGVETPQELACVFDLGVSLVQGFVFAKPSPLLQDTVAWPSDSQ